MTEPPPEAVFGRWVHSSEESEETAAVYRPEGVDLPPARGRVEIEFHPDGTVIEWEIGPDDVPRPVEGVWIRQSLGRLRLSFPGTGRPDRVADVAEAANGILRLRNEELG
jgi:hypothetical protein